MTSTISLKVPTNTQSIRLDKWLSEQLPQFSRQTIQTLIETGAVQLNGKSLKKKDLVKDRDEVTVSLPKTKPTHIEPQQVDFSVIYEDGHIIVINKPSGLVVHPGAGNHDQTLVNGLVYLFDDLQTEEGDIRPGIVHRLDKDTSGVMIIAKSKEAHFKLGESFANRQVKKTYLALTIGKPTSLSCNQAIRRHQFKRQEMACDPLGKPAHTDFEILDFCENISLVKAKPITGRTHQIRVHLKYLKSPIFADPIYGCHKKEEEETRLMLHAYEISFNHPISQESLTFKAPVPQDMSELIRKKLKKDFTL